jgi:thiosulfate reductase cytochrome b subunit
MSSSAASLAHNVSMAFWLAAAGAILAGIGEVAGIGALVVIGAALFACGIVWFLINAVGRSRDENVGMGTAMARASRDALRFALHLMP